MFDIEGVGRCIVRWHVGISDFKSLIFQKNHNAILQPEDHIMNLYHNLRETLDYNFKEMNGVKLLGIKKGL